MPVLTTRFITAIHEIHLNLFNPPVVPPYLKGGRGGSSLPPHPLTTNQAFFPQEGPSLWVILYCSIQNRTKRSEFSFKGGVERGCRVRRNRSSLNAEAERLSEGGVGDDEMVPRSPPRGGRTGGDRRKIYFGAVGVHNNNPKAYFIVTKFRGSTILLLR